MSALQFRQLRSRKRAPAETQQGLVQSADWKRPSVRWGLGGTQTALLVLLVIIGLGPILWLAKAAITPTQDTLSNPMAIFPHGTALSNISDAWNQVDIGLYIWLRPPVPSRSRSCAPSGDG
jgi:multiple sugar transport system permease protein